MSIQSMTEPASLELLARATLGRLACANEGRPYIIPMSVTYDANALYGFSTVGQKIAWMRANPHVCVEVEEVVSSGGLGHRDRHGAISGTNQRCRPYVRP